MGAQLKREVAVSRSPAHGDSNTVRSDKMASELQRGADPNQSIRALYEAHADEISSFLKARFGGGPPDPQDIVQQTFANFLGKANGAAIRNPRAFLYRIAINLTIQQRRAAQRRRKLLPEYARTHGDATDELHPERVLLAKEQVRALEDALNQLGGTRSYVTAASSAGGGFLCGNRAPHGHGALQCPVRHRTGAEELPAGIAKLRTMGLP